MCEWVVFAHGDSDGVSSAALVKAFLEEQGCRVRVVFTHPVGLLSDIAEFYRGCGGMFIVDVAISELYLRKILDLLSEESKLHEVVYVDHHPLLEDINIPGEVEWVHNTCCSSAELTYKHLHSKGLNPEYSRVALYGAIGDYLDETAWVREEMRKWDKRAIYLEAGILIQGLEGSRRDHDFKRRIVDHLAGNYLPSTMGELVERSLKQAIEDENLRVWVKSNVTVVGGISYVVNPPGSVGKAANYARIYGNTRVGAAIEVRGEVYVMSLRGEAGVDLNRVLRELSKELGINGGGHPLAAGARVRKEAFPVFLEELNKRISST